MFKTSRIRAACYLATASLLLASCVPGADVADAPVTLTLGHTWSSTDANAKAVQQFADSVEEASHGDLRIEVYPGGQLGEDVEMLEGLGLETVDIWVGGSGVYSQISPVGEFLVMPFMFTDIDEAMNHYNGTLGEAVKQVVLDTSDTRLLSLWPRGARHLTLNSEAKVPNDISGLRVRVPENPMILRTWAALGASPTPMPFGDVTTALQQGALDGQENPLETIKTAGLASAQSHLILTAHVIEPTAVSISEAAWKELDKEDRATLDSAANGAPRDQLLEYVRNSEESLLDEFRADDITVVEPNRDAFIDRVGGLAEEAGPEVTKLYETRWSK